MNTKHIEQQLNRVTEAGGEWAVQDAGCGIVTVMLSKAPEGDPTDLEPLDISASRLTMFLPLLPDGLPLGEEGEDNTLIDFLCVCVDARNIRDVETYATSIASEKASL